MHFTILKAVISEIWQTRFLKLIFFISRVFRYAPDQWPYI
jgi:hypothetical protein